MIEGHGDDSYKFERPIMVNFSSNVYNRVAVSYTHLLPIASNTRIPNQNRAWIVLFP